jgi:pimeloyl-ACP methyl ester carboxylesterase
MSSKHGLPITSSRIRVVPALLGGVATVPVHGGLLTYEILAGSTEPVLAIHGVSSQRRLWNWLHAEAPELTLIAPDLRGRGDSAAISASFSLAQHVEDMIGIFDHLEIDSVHILGMSMGGFVAMRLAAEHPARVKSLILVDGGFPMSTPPGLYPRDGPGSLRRPDWAPRTLVGQPRRLHRLLRDEHRAAPRSDRSVAA